MFFRFKSQAYLAGKVYGSRYGVDVALADFGSEADTLQSESFLAFAGIEPPIFHIYPVELHIAEKLHAYTLPRTRPNSRVKDLPDIALLANLGELEVGEICKAIQLTFERRGTHPIPERLPPPPDSWGPVYKRLASTSRLPWRDLEEVWEAARSFLDPALKKGEGTWSPDKWVWKSAD